MPLILQRHLNESILIDEDIEVKVALIDGNRIKLMIDAPENVPVHRKEIFLKIKKDQKVGLEA